MSSFGWHYWDEYDEPPKRRRRRRRTIKVQQSDNLTYWTMYPLGRWLKFPEQVEARYSEILSQHQMGIYPSITTTCKLEGRDMSYVAKVGGQYVKKGTNGALSLVDGNQQATRVDNRAAANALAAAYDISVRPDPARPVKIVPRRR